jgi:hypothetical protein
MISWEIDEKIDKKKETLYGNFAGDFYKGKIERINLPDNLKEGLVLHRIIDGISDRKENFLNELLHEKFHHFKGIVSDMFIDHFLSKNFYRVFNENINDIEKKILYNLHYNSKFFTEEFERTFNWIQLENVLIKYADINFLEMAFRGISHRIRNGKILREAVTELKKNYDVFEEKSLSEFNYTKNKSIEKFLEINKIGGVEK